MGFWKTLGKIGLKVAPYAALAIPGVGPLASAGIAAGIKGAETKARGGSWGDALKGAALAGGTAAAGGAIASKVPGLDKVLGKGISPSAGTVQNAVSGTANKALGGGGFARALGNVGKQVGTSALRNSLMPESGAPQTWQDALGGAVAGMIRNRGQNQQTGQAQPTGGVPQYPGDYAGTMEGIGPSPLMMRNQNFPNLAEALNAGRQEVLRKRIA